MSTNSRKWGTRYLVGALGLVVALLSGCATEQVDVREEKQLVFPDTPGDDPRFYFERVLRSSADVMPDDERNDIGMQSLVTGSSSVGGKSFGKPYAVAVYQGRVLVSDTLHRTIMVFDPANGQFTEFGNDGLFSLRKPMGMKVDRQGNIYVLDASAKQVAIFDKAGKYIRSVGEKEMFDRPSSVAVNPEGTRIFVVDTGSSRGNDEFHRIVVYDPRDGKHLFNIGKRGTGDGEFNLLRDATVSPKDGLLYVVDGGNFRVQVFDQDGNFKRKFGSVGRNLGQFARPKGIAINAQGYLFISDAAHGNFQIFDPDGALMLFVGTRGGNEPAKYLLPAQIAVDEDGRVYMLDQAFARLDIYRPAEIKETEGYLGRAFVKMNEPEPGSPKGSKAQKSTPPKANPVSNAAPPKAETPKEAAVKAESPKGAADKAEAPQDAPEGLSLEEEDERALP